VKLVDRPLPAFTGPDAPHAMVPCDAILARLWDYLDGVATPNIVGVIDRHLAACPGCHAQYVFQQSFLRSLRRLGQAWG